MTPSSDELLAEAIYEQKRLTIKVEQMQREAAIRTQMLDRADEIIDRQKQELTTLRANVDPFDMIKKLGAAYQALQEYAVVLGDRGPNA